jgi:hypothetical protein
MAKPPIPSKVNRPHLSGSKPSNIPPPPKTRSFSQLPSATEWQKLTPANRPAGRSLDPLLRMIDDLMENLRKAQDGTYLYLLGQLFFTTMSWLNHFKMDPHRALPAHRSPILSLNLFAGNELAAKLGVPLGSLASKLQQIYGVNMEQHGLNTDTDTIRQRYMDAASREQYRVFIRHGRAFFYNTHSHKLVARSTGQDGFGFALSMSNELYAAPMSNKYHSYFMAGRPVQCAGHIWFDPGYVTRVKNSSGHYKPLDLAMVKLLNYFRMNGLDLSRIEVIPVRFKLFGTQMLADESTKPTTGDIFMKHNGNWDSIKARAKHQKAF